MRRRFAGAGGGGMALKTGRRAAVAPFHAMEAFRAAHAREARGERVLHLEVGEPAAGAPAQVLEAARRALAERRIGYTEALGILALRERIARHYDERYGVAIDPSRVAVTHGASAAFTLAFLSAFDPGDRVALAEPGYPAYRNILSALDIEAVPLAVGPKQRFQPDPELLDAAAPLDGVIVASPSNPTGSMLDPQGLAAIADWGRRNGARSISDEIYHGISYGRRESSVLEHDSDAVAINSFSKYFGMTGWRLGWAVIPESLVGAFDRLAQNFFISASSLAQYAALEAFDCRAELDARVAGYARNRELLLERLPRAGFVLPAPVDGAFYIYADIGALAEDSRAFCAAMLEETGVAATPGVDFDRRSGARFVRFSFAGSEAEIAEAADRLEAAYGPSRQTAPRGTP